jgi:hypothetical protein
MELGIFAWIWQPIASPLQIIAAGVVLAALTIFAYARTFTDHKITSAILLAMRLALVLGVVVLMMGPSRVPPSSDDFLRPNLAIVLDGSQSMLTEDCQNMSRMRFAKSKWLTADRLRRLNDTFDVELYLFDDQLKAISRGLLYRGDEQVASGSVTRLSESVRDAVNCMPIDAKGAAMLVISDGHDTEGAPIQPAASLAQGRDIPVFTLPLGRAAERADITVLAVAMQDYLLPNEPGAILVKVYQSGLDDAKTTLILRHGEEKHQVPIDFNNQRMVEVQVPIQEEEEGQYEYVIEVEPVGEEAEHNNNSQVVFSEVQKKRIQVLILEGQPFWDSKFLAQSLRKDERLAITQITQVSPDKRETIVTRVDGPARKLPETAEQWANFDVVILGQGLEKMLDVSAAEQLVEFVSNQGGHVIFSRGQAYDPESPEGMELAEALAPLEPVQFAPGSREKVMLAVAPAGRVGYWFSPAKLGMDIEDAWGRVQGFDWMPNVESVKPVTVVLARASITGDPLVDSSHPALVSMRQGRGGVVGMLGEGTWRWSLLAPENRDLAGFYDTFWSNMVRWLAAGGDFQPGQQVSMHLSRSSVRLNDNMEVDVVYKFAPQGGAEPVLEVTESSGETRQVALERTPGRVPRYRGTWQPVGLGVHNVKLVAPGMVPDNIERKFNVYHFNIERLETSANPMPLQVLAEHTGARCFQPHQGEELIATLKAHRDSYQKPKELEYIWDRWSVMLLLLIWGGTEWILRRRVDLL